MSTNNTQSLSYRIAIVGPENTVSGFKALGVEVFDAVTPTDALSQLRRIKLVSNDPTDNRTYAVVCVIDDVLAGVDQAEYSKVVAGALPAVVVLPGPNGTNGLAVEHLRVLAQKAVGSAII